jgi:hypothetical protein
VAARSTSALFVGALEAAAALIVVDGLADALLGAVPDAGALLETGVKTLVAAGPAAPVFVRRHPSATPLAGVLVAAPDTAKAHVPSVPSALTGAVQYDQ